MRRYRGEAPMTKTRVKFDSETNFSHFVDRLSNTFAGLLIDHDRRSVVFYDGMDDDTRSEAEHLGAVIGDPEEVDTH
jgi:hypothetical protein